MLYFNNSECMEREARRLVQLERLKKQIRNAYDNVPMYKKKFEEAGIVPEDIRELGSKNPGSTNMLRIYGKKTAIFTLIIDVLKGVIGVLIGLIVDILIKESPSFSYFEAHYLLGSMKYIAGIFAVLGHDFPIYFRFKGGKGVATSLGVILMLDWKIGLIIMVCAILIMLFSRYVSLGSIIAGIVYPCVITSVMIAKGDFNVVYFIQALIIGIMVVIKHHANINRLLSGNENKLFSKKDK